MSPPPASPSLDSVFAGSPRARAAGGGEREGAVREHLRAPGFFQLRSPALPLGLLKDVASSSGDVAHARAKLAELLQRPDVMEAVRVASPGLAQRAAEWLADPAADATRKTEQALMRYVARMCSRATPFGLFSAVSWGEMANITVLGDAVGSTPKRRTRLDSVHLYALAQKLERAPEIACGLKWRPATSLYAHGSQYRLVEVAPDRHLDGMRRFKLSGLDRDATLESALQFARPGVTLEALRRHVRETTGASEEDTAEYVADLLQAQALVSDLPPPLTGSDPLAYLQARIHILRAHDEAARLGKVQSLLARMDASCDTDASSLELELWCLLEPGNPSPPPPNLVQIDLFKPGRATLASTEVDELAQVLTTVARVSAAPSTRLDDFKKAFARRFEQREVPLMLALDEESGVSFDTEASAGQPDILKGLKLGRPPVQDAYTARLTEWDMFVMRTVAAALQQGLHEAVLDDARMTEMNAASRLPLPADCVAMLQMLPASTSSSARWSVSGLAGASAASLFGRFCHLDDEMKNGVQAFLESHERKYAARAIVAEVVHLPAERHANVIVRPVLSRYEIPYMASSGVPVDRQIALDDLMLSLRGDELVLRSRRLGRRVIPRLSCAHNFDTPASLATYRFLGALQYDNQPVSSIAGPEFLNVFPFVPRIVYRHVVLRAAQWTINEPTVKRWKKAPLDERVALVAQWRAEQRWPRVLTYADGDNVMLVDLENPLLVDNLVELLPEDGGRVSEWLGAFDADHHAHEIVLPLVRSAYERRATDDFSSTGNDPVDIVHAPGSHWLFAKIYCGEGVADQLLNEVVAPLVQMSREATWASSWFFIRYADPSHHLRLRFNGDPQVLNTQVLPALQQALQPWLDSGIVHDFQIDSFRPEIERYGGLEAHDICCRLFEHDSDAAAMLLTHALPRAEQADLARWFYACAATHRLVSAVFTEATQRLGAVRHLSAAMRARFSPTKQQDGQIGERFRQHRRALEPMLLGAKAMSADAQTAWSILEERDARFAEPIGHLKRLDAAGELVTPLVDIVASLSHMSLNRLLRTQQNPQEMLIYDFLDRMYSSWAARERVAQTARIDTA